MSTSAAKRRPLTATPQARTSALGESATPHADTTRSTAHPKPDKFPTAPVPIIIEPRALVRDMFVRTLSEAMDQQVRAFASLREFTSLICDDPVGVIVLNHLGPHETTAAMRDLAEIQASGCVAAPIVIVSEEAARPVVVKALEAGARGFIPTDTPLDVMVEALRVVLAGGTYVPASCLMGRSRTSPARRTERAAPTGGAASNGMSIFTARQRSVVDAITRGMANKAIARELNMRESTVKVHVRNIMKKLNARNRTEVAFIANKLMQR